MTFNSHEYSDNAGAPVALYELRWGNTFWRYTSADRDIEYLGNSFQAVACSDGGVKQGGSPTNEFTMTIQADVPIVDLYKTTPPSAPIRLTVRRMHYGDEDAMIHWIGKVANVKRKDGRTTAEIRAISLGASLGKLGLRLTWDRNCPHILYDSECKVNLNMFRTDTVVTGITAESITVADNGAYGGRYRGGIIVWDSDGLGTPETRGIMEEYGHTYRIFGRVDRLQVGDPVTIHPGCDRTTETCLTNFANLPNHGGFPQMPGKSPFDGTPIF